MITAEQRANRKNHLGGSDLPAILGYGRKRTACDVWLEKTGRLVDDPNEPRPDYFDAGNDYEPGVIKWAQRHHYIGEVDTDPKHLELAVPDTPIILHPDGIEIQSGLPVEVKIEGLFGPMFNEWGDAGTNEVSEYTCIQAQGHMMATDRPLCHIPTHLGFRGRQYFYVERDEKLVQLIKEKALRFWNEYVLTDTPPPDSVPSLSLIKKIRRVEGEPVALAEDMIDEWFEAKHAAKLADNRKEQAQSAILAALDGKPEGVCARGLITNYEQSRKETIQRASTFRVMRLKKAKK